MILIFHILYHYNVDAAVFSKAQDEGLAAEFYYQPGCLWSKSPPFLLPNKHKMNVKTPHEGKTAIPELALSRCGLS